MFDMKKFRDWEGVGENEVSPRNFGKVVKTFPKKEVRTSFYFLIKMFFILSILMVILANLSTIIMRMAIIVGAKRAT